MVMVAYPELAAIRLGYGLSPLAAPPAGPDEVLASVARAGPGPEPVTMAEVQELRETARNLSRDRMRGDEAARKASRRLQKRVDGLVARAHLRDMARAVDDPSGFGERLVRFWADHFTVASGNAYFRYMAISLVDEAIRPHIAGRFEDMLFAAETHPRMITYLNQDRSVGPGSAFAERRPKQASGLNENLAREMIELHSLGVGAPYSQKDVRQLAELLTGLTYDLSGKGKFRPARAEPGAEIVLGRSYGGDGPARLQDIRAMTRDLARHPATARHLAHKLAVHFAADDPPQSLVDRLTAIYADSKGDLALLNAELAQAPELQETFRLKLRQPYEFIIASLRALRVSGADILGLPPERGRNWLIRAMKPMGQTWGAPRGPDGWPEAAENWVTPQGLAARIDWAMRMPAKLQPDLPDPRDFMQTALGDTASDALQWAVPKAETIQDGLAIVLASADFNRR